MIVPYTPRFQNVPPVSFVCATCGCSCVRSLACWPALGCGIPCCLCVRVQVASGDMICFIGASGDVGGGDGCVALGGGVHADSGDGISYAWWDGTVFGSGFGQMNLRLLLYCDVSNPSVSGFDFAKISGPRTVSRYNRCGDGADTAVSSNLFAPACVDGTFSVTTTISSAVGTGSAELLISPGPCGFAGRRAIAETTRVARPQSDNRNGRRCLLLADRIDFNTGCSGWNCKHRCASDRDDVARHLGGIMETVPGDDCQDCPGFIDGGPFRTGGRRP